MNTLIFTSVCTLSIAFSTVAYGQSMQGASPPEADHAVDSPSEKAGNHTAPPRVNVDPATDARSTSTGQRRDGANHNDYSVEGANSGSTATSSGSPEGGADDRDSRKGATSSPNGGRVVHPKEP